MRVGTHWRTAAGMIGCMMAIPADMTMVVANRMAKSVERPRSAEPVATSTRPPTSAVVTPNRATSSDPASEAIANSAGGMLESRPTSVALKPKSSRIIASTGGTARIVSRRPAPASHSSISATGRLWRQECRSLGIVSAAAPHYRRRSPCGAGRALFFRAQQRKKRFGRRGLNCPGRPKPDTRCQAISFSPPPGPTAPGSWRRTARTASRRPGAHP